MSEENQPEVVSRKLRVGLIHNNDAERLAHIRPALAALGPNVSVSEIVEQPPVVTQSWPLFLRRRALTWSLQRAWRRHRGLPPRLPILDLLRYPRDLLRNHDRRRAAIEVILADKHLKAWRDFVRSGEEFLLVLEDDAVFDGQSKRGLNEALALVDARPTYVDIAGGFTPAELSVDALEIGRIGRFREYARPVSNTGGGYLMNRALARHMVELVDSHPDWRLLPADWIINRCFLALVEKGYAVRCLLALDPTILVHGSHAGTYSSTVN
jgi:hypothetical protein